MRVGYLSTPLFCISPITSASSSRLTVLAEEGLKLSVVADQIIFSVATLNNFVASDTRVFVLVLPVVVIIHAIAITGSREKTVCSRIIPLYLAYS